MASINRDMPISLHFQVANDIKEAIKSGKWSKGDMLPADKVFVEEYGVSITTIRHAMSTLVNEGLIERRAGKGTTLIREMLEERLGEPTGFFEEALAMGLKGSARVIGKRIINISDKDGQQIPRLNILGVDRVYQIEIIQSINDKPVNYLTSYWSYEYCKDFKDEELVHEGIYEQLFKRFGIVITEADQKITADRAKAKEASLLEIKPGAPILRVTRMGYSNGKVIELSLNAYRGDSYSYSVHLNRNGPIHGKLVIE